jgi:3-deoxy-D-manno-octulosonic-acid transferase
MPADDPEATRQASRDRLRVHDEPVFICGSTHDGEEELLLAVYRQLAERGPFVWVLAPRHLERLETVANLMRRAGVDFDRFSQLKVNGRTTRVVLVDTMGDLADLYAGGDYLFCGGSLVDRGGHNIIEAARWGRPVYFGPHMKDFRDAADLLVEAGGGFQADDADSLATLVFAHLDDPDCYREACASAAAAAVGQRGAVRRQVEIVLDLLTAD